MTKKERARAVEEALDPWVQTHWWDGEEAKGVWVAECGFTWKLGDPHLKDLMVNGSEPHPCLRCKSLAFGGG